MVGLARLELATPSLSGTYSNHLSYNPILKLGLIGLMKVSKYNLIDPIKVSFKKEVIQPQVPLRLPCYDFTPVIAPTVDALLLAVRVTS